MGDREEIAFRGLFCYYCWKEKGILSAILCILKRHHVRFTSHIICRRKKEAEGLNQSLNQKVRKER